MKYYTDQLNRPVKQVPATHGCDGCLYAGQIEGERFPHCRQYDAPVENLATKYGRVLCRTNDAIYALVWPRFN
jgi:hypothetical protein